MRQVIRGKPYPCGLKIFVCADPDGLPIDFMYEGKGDSILSEDTFQTLDVGGKAVISLS